MKKDLVSFKENPPDCCSLAGCCPLVVTFTYHLHRTLLEKQREDNRARTSKLRKKSNRWC